MGKLLSDESMEDYVRMCVYGKTGSGKSTLGVTAPKPFIVLSERQGYMAVADAARRLGIPTPPTLWCESLEDVRAVIRALRSDEHEPIPTALRAVLGDGPEVEEKIQRLPYVKPETVVADSVTDIFNLIAVDIERVAGKKIGKDGLESKPERFWGVLRDRSEALIRAFRDLPYDLLFLALLTDAEIGEGDEKSRYVVPTCPMKALPNSLGAAVNIVGIMSVKERLERPEEGDPFYSYERWVRFAGPSWMMTKTMAQLRDKEVLHVGAWIERIRANADPGPLDIGDYVPQSRVIEEPEEATAGRDDASSQKKRKKQA